MNIIAKSLPKILKLLSTFSILEFVRPAVLVDECHDGLAKKNPQTNFVPFSTFGLFSSNGHWPCFYKSKKTSHDHKCTHKAQNAYLSTSMYLHIGHALTFTKLFETS